MEPSAPQAGSLDQKQSQAREALATELFARLCALVGLGLFALLALRRFRQHGDAIALLQLIDQSLNVLFIVIASFPAVVDRRPQIVLLAVATTFSNLALDYTSGHALAPHAVSVALQLAGISLEAISKISLWRSFGIVPANRGVRTGGAYLFVRHPMYLGYAIAQLGVLLARASWRNLIVIAAADLLLVLRARFEEQVLARDEAYRAYQSRVRWRIIPFVY